MKSMQHAISSISSRIIISIFCITQYFDNLLLHTALITHSNVVLCSQAQLVSVMLMEYVCLQNCNPQLMHIGMKP